MLQIGRKVFAPPTHLQFTGQSVGAPSGGRALHAHPRGRTSKHCRRFWLVGWRHVTLQLISLDGVFLLDAGLALAWLWLRFWEIAAQSWHTDTQRTSETLWPRLLRWMSSRSPAPFALNTTKNDASSASVSTVTRVSLWLSGAYARATARYLCFHKTPRQTSDPG